jgi:hypothetical protein
VFCEWQSGSVRRQGCGSSLRLAGQRTKMNGKSPPPDENQDSQPLAARGIAAAGTDIMMLLLACQCRCRCKRVRTMPGGEVEAGPQIVINVHTVPCLETRSAAQVR